MPRPLCGSVGGRRDDAHKEKLSKQPHDQTQKKREKQCSSEGLANAVYNSRNITFNTPTFGFVCHAEFKTNSLDSVVYPSTQLRAIILAETVLVEASATLSAGQGCEGIKTLSTQQVATAHMKAYSKISTLDIDLHVAPLTSTFTHRGALWQGPEHALMAVPFSKLGRSSGWKK